MGIIFVFCGVIWALGADPELVVSDLRVVCVFVAFACGLVFMILGAV